MTAKSSPLTTDDADWTRIALKEWPTHRDAYRKQHPFKPNPDPSPAWEEKRILQGAEGSPIEIVFCNRYIENLEVDAIVNAAKPSLEGGLGVDGAVHEAASGHLKEECLTIPKVKGGRCPTGEARITKGYRLPATYVIHTVGPRGDQQDKEQLLQNCYKNVLHVCDEHHLESVGFPCISAGIYGYNVKEAAPEIFKAVQNYAAQPGIKVKKIIFTLITGEQQQAYQQAFGSLPRVL